MMFNNVIGQRWVKRITSIPSIFNYKKERCNQHYEEIQVQFFFPIQSWNVVITEIGITMTGDCIELILSNRHILIFTLFILRSFLLLQMKINKFVSVYE